jgi:fructokinase
LISVCGEGLVDLVDEGGGVFRAHPGGSPLNVATGLARLGQPTSLLARLGHDRFGTLLRAHLADSGVCDRDLVDATEPTTLAVVAVGTTATATYDFYVRDTAAWRWHPGDLPDRLADDVRALHTGSLASWLPPSTDAVEALLRAEHRRGAVTLTYDPNVRPALLTGTGDGDAARRAVHRLVGLVDVVKVSDEDLAWLHPDRDPLDTARRWAEAGPALVVVTHGAAGATALTRGGLHVTRPAHHVPVVDTVGAGDAFTAGMLTWLAEADALGRRPAPDLDGPGLAAMLDFAGLVAALTCGRAGATPPTRAEVDRAHRQPR